MLASARPKHHLIWHLMMLDLRLELAICISLMNDFTHLVCKPGNWVDRLDLSWDVQAKCMAVLPLTVFSQSCHAQIHHAICSWVSLRHSMKSIEDALQAAWECKVRAADQGRSWRALVAVFDIVYLHSWVIWLRFST